MKKFIYRLAAFLLLITEDPDIWLDAVDTNPYKKDTPYSYFNFGDVLDFIIEYHIESWWDLITSRNIDMWSAPWVDSVTSIMIAAQKGLIEHPETPYSWTESDHHHRWRNSLLESKGYVRD
jgi:hypothetical protein